MDATYAKVWDGGYFFQWKGDFSQLLSAISLGWQNRDRQNSDHARSHMRAAMHTE